MLEAITFWALFALSPQGVSTSQLHSMTKISEYTDGVSCTRAIRDNTDLLPSSAKITYVCQQVSEVIRPKAEPRYKLISISRNSQNLGVATVIAEYDSINTCSKNKFTEKNVLETICISTGK